ncbi:hypothetical protein OF83DRAFT_298296 [Amylostereum chailletii]|nr:hypothetical protein OF83DRAFT_298296 [Amylostereum chailletii]
MAEPPHISNLPIELLGRIFGYLPSCNDEKILRNSPMPSWLAVTHVCRQWRAASLCHASLWTDIITSPLSWTEKSLSRSGTAPITLNIAWRWDTTTTPLPKVLATALTHFPRAKAFKLLVNNVPQNLSMIPTQEALYLNHLHLHDFSHNSSTLDKASVLYENMPNLRSICLSNCNIPWTLWSPGGLFRWGLKSLRISFSPMCLLQRPSSAELHACLASLPLLERLALDDVLSRDDDAIGILLTAALKKVPPHPVINLPNLRRLSLKAIHSPSTVQFLYTLCAPSSTGVEVTYFHANNSVNRSPFFPVSLSLSVIHLLSTMQSPIQDNVLVVRISKSRHVADLNWTASFTSVPTESLPADPRGGAYPEGLFPESPSIRIGFDTVYMPHSHLADLAAFQRVFLFFAVRRAAARLSATAVISVACPVFIHWELWWNIFSLTSPSYLLRVEGDEAAFGLVGALGVEGVESNDFPLVDLSQEACSYYQAFNTASDLDKHPRYLFPTTSHIEFFRVDFTVDDNAISIRLKSALELRREAEAGEVVPLERLDITLCAISPEQVEELKVFFSPREVISWDGVESRKDLSQIIPFQIVCDIPL